VATSDQALRDEIHKRFTLNWLIQGAAQHAGMTSHHLVRDELNVLDPRLVRLYDQFALVGIIQYWRPQAALIFGSPRNFWRQAALKHSHPFFGHSLLSKYGGMLAEEARRRALERCKEKGVTRLPFVFSFRAMFLLLRLRKLETPHRPRLVQLAKKSTSMVWGIPGEQLDGGLANRIELGDMLPEQRFRDAIIRAFVQRYVNVVQRGDALMVVGRATNWQLLTHELVKGTAELICLHGLSQLSDDTYRSVLQATDRLELESWMLQSGGELWRRLLASLPDGRPLARVLMHLARLPASALESIIATVIQEPQSAQRHLAELADENRP
jgi:hypothetical protein